MEYTCRFILTLIGAWVAPSKTLSATFFEYIYNSTCTMTPVIHNISDLHAFGDKPINVWVALYCCPEKFCSMGRSKAKNGKISGILHTAYRKKFYCKLIILLETRHTRGVLLAVSTHQISRTQNQEP